MMYLGDKAVGIAYLANNVVIVDIPENDITLSNEVSDFFISKIPQTFDFYTVMQLDFDRATATNNQLVCAFYVNDLAAQRGTRYRDGEIVAFNYAESAYANCLKSGTRYILTYGKAVTPNG